MTNSGQPRAEKGKRESGSDEPIDLDSLEVDEEAMVMQRNRRAEEVSTFKHSLHFDLRDPRHQMARLQEQLKIEQKIKAGAESLFQLYTMKDDQAALKGVRQQLEAVNAKIAALTEQHEAIKNAADRETFR